MFRVINEIFLRYRQLWWIIAIWNVNKFANEGHKESSPNENVNFFKDFGYARQEAKDDTRNKCTNANENGIPLECFFWRKCKLKRNKFQ